VLQVKGCHFRVTLKNPEFLVTLLQDTKANVKVTH